MILATPALTLDGLGYIEMESTSVSNDTNIALRFKTRATKGIIIGIGSPVSYIAAEVLGDRVGVSIKLNTGQYLSIIQILEAKILLQMSRELQADFRGVVMWGARGLHTQIFRLSANFLNINSAVQRCIADRTRGKSSYLSANWARTKSVSANWSRTKSVLANGGCAG